MADAVDVCVVGSGAGGAPAALALAEAGFSVVVLEKGPARARADFTHDELAMVRRDFFVPFAADDPHFFRASPEATARATNFGWISSCVGGGTVHWAGYAYRFHPDDFRRATLTGGVSGADVSDWPFGYDELEPYYARAERELGVSGAASCGAWEPPRSGPYPLPPLLAHPLATLLDGSLGKAGIAPQVTPRAILSVPDRGRNACVYCAHCAGYGCEVGAKGSTSEALLPRAVATGRCEVRAGAMARQVLVDQHGRASSVVYRGSDGQEHEQKAALVILACSAIETPRLLLASRSKLFPDGLANSSGLVGKQLMMLTLGRASGLFRYGGKAGLAAPSPLPFLGRTVRQFQSSEGTVALELSSHSAINVAEKLALGSGPKSLWGKALKDRLRAHAGEGVHVEAECFSGCLPRTANAVDLGGGGKDLHGHPAARITFAHHPDDGVASTKLVGRASELLAAAGADEVVRREAGGTFDVIQAGTCRAGTDPARSVLDRDCRAHDVPNLHVLDGSFMPTSGGVPGTLTIVANSLRVADAIVADARRSGLRSSR